VHGLAIFTESSASTLHLHEEHVIVGLNGKGTGS
jgi:hypothetical protein